jgi:hypothetical protein
MEDALLDQHTLTAKSTTAVDKVKAMLLGKVEVLATVKG